MEVACPSASPQIRGWAGGKHRLGCAAGLARHPLLRNRFEEIFLLNPNEHRDETYFRPDEQTEHPANAGTGFTRKEYSL
jgi:hypothetical protein